MAEENRADIKRGYLNYRLIWLLVGWGIIFYGAYELTPIIFYPSSKEAGERTVEVKIELPPGIQYMEKVPVYGHEPVLKNVRPKYIETTKEVFFNLTDVDLYYQLALSHKYGPRAGNEAMEIIYTAVKQNDRRIQYRYVQAIVSPLPASSHGYYRIKMNDAGLRDAGVRPGEKIAYATFNFRLQLYIPALVVLIAFLLAYIYYFAVFYRVAMIIKANRGKK